MKNRMILSVSLALATIGQWCMAEVTVSSVFGDNMVLQQNTEVALWGRADPGETVRVLGSWDGAAEKAVRGSKDGKWFLKIKTPSAGGPYKLAVAGKNKIHFENIMIGEVWLCSGQSNMEFPVKRANHATEEIAAANWPNIRFFKVERNVAGQPKEECSGSWVICSPETVPGFSAAAYFFGRELNQKLGVPIGLVLSSWGGTPAESWMPEEVLESNPDFLPILDRSRKNANKEDPKRACVLYNGMIAPLMPFTIKGTIWYQGESNTRRAYQYRSLFPALIGSWRSLWAQGDFPFYYVQIAPFRYKKSWTDWISYELREAQLMALNVPNTGMAVTMDIGNVEDIHPTNKQDVGKRLALWALAKDYGHDGLICSGPVYKSMEVEGDKIRLHFDYAGSGLMAKGGDLTHFEIAGEDREFVEAYAEIQRDTLVVSNSEIKNPVAVRYGWSDTAEPNLFNKEGLPASSFRTDQWPGITDGKK